MQFTLTSVLRKSLMFGLPLVAYVMASEVALAAKAKTYQIAGSVVAVTETTLTILKKSGEHVIMERDAITRTSNGPVKVGDQVNVTYMMAADQIDVKSSSSATTEDGATQKSNKAKTSDQQFR